MRKFCAIVLFALTLCLTVNAQDNCTLCENLLLPAREVFDEDPPLQFAFFSLVDEEQFRIIRESADAGGAFGPFGGGYSEEEYREERKRMHNSSGGWLSRGRSLDIIRERLPEQYALYNDCLKNCALGNIGLTLTPIFASKEFVQVRMTWNYPAGVDTKNFKEAGTLEGGVLIDSSVPPGWNRPLPKNYRLSMNNSRETLTYRRTSNSPFILKIKFTKNDQFQYGADLPIITWPLEPKPAFVDKIRIETRTGMHSAAGSKGRIVITIGNKPYNLPHPHHYKKGTTDVFELYSQGPTKVSDLTTSSVSICNLDWRKKHAGWQCESIKIWYKVDLTAEEIWFPLFSQSVSPGWLDEKYGDRRQCFDFANDNDFRVFSIADAEESNSPG